MYLASTGSAPREWSTGVRCASNDDSPNRGVIAVLDSTSPTSSSRGSTGPWHWIRAGTCAQTTGDGRYWAGGIQVLSFPFLPFSVSRRAGEASSKRPLPPESAPRTRARIHAQRTTGNSKLGFPRPQHRNAVEALADVTREPTLFRLPSPRLD